MLRDRISSSAPPEPVALGAAVGSLEPIGLGELERCAALTRRVERKYLLGADVARALVGLLAPTHRALEIGGRRRFAYRSTYFDSAELRIFRDHVAGRRRRFKCRTRLYADTGLCVAEVKLRGGRGGTTKHRMELPAREDGRLGRAATAFVAEHVLAGCGRPAPEPLRPALVVTYRRITLVAPEEGERVTIDADLAFGAAGGLRPQLVVVETKSRTGRGAADRMLRDLRARPVEGLSKYCAGIALSRPDARANPLLPLLRRGFVAGQASSA